MKKLVKLLSSCALILCLLAGMLTVSAFAESYNCEVNRAFPESRVFRASADVTGGKLSYGSLPAGMKFTATGADVYLSGTPTETGTFECAYWVETANGWEDFIVNVTVTGDEYADPNSKQETEKKDSAPTITKHPTGETVEVGGTAKFVARADNATSIVWRIVSADTTNTVPAADAPAYFSGLKVEGLDTERLVLSNIPKSMNKWSVEAKFVGPGGVSYSNGAIIKVVDDINAPAVTAAPATKTSAPEIVGQPQAASAAMGQDISLSVVATAADGGTLKYQWYSSPTDSKASIVSVSGATEPTFTVPQVEGTAYYCVSVVNSKDGKESTAVYSDLVKVEYTPAAAAPAPTSDPAASSPASGTGNEFGGTAITPAATSAPSAQTTSANDRYSNSGISTSVIFFGITGLLAVAAIVVILIFIKKSGADNEE